MALTDNEKAFALVVVVGAGVLLLGSSRADAATAPGGGAGGSSGGKIPTAGGAGYGYDTGTGYGYDTGSTGYQTEVTPLAPGTGVWTPESTGTGSAGGGGYSTTTGGTARGRPEVQRMQEQLADLGYDPGVIDGRFGPDTQRALDDFARSVGTRFSRGYSATTANAVSQAWASSSGSGSSGYAGSASVKELSGFGRRY